MASLRLSLSSLVHVVHQDYVREVSGPKPSGTETQEDRELGYNFKGSCGIVYWGLDHGSLSSIQKRGSEKTDGPGAVRNRTSTH